MAALALKCGGDPSPHQRRLAATRRADHGEHPGRGQPPETGLDIVLPSEVRVGVADVVRDQATVRACRAGLGKGDGGRQRRILAQDGLLQGDEIGARLQSQLGDQNTASLAQTSQGVALASRLVLGEGQQRPPALAQRRLGGAGLGLAQDVAVATGPQGGVDANLLGVKAKLLQPAGLDAAGLPVVECAERPPAPQRQRLAADVRRALVLAEDQQLVTAPDQTLEASGVDVIGGRLSR